MHSEDKLLDAWSPCSISWSLISTGRGAVGPDESALSPRPISWSLISTSLLDVGTDVAMVVSVPGLTELTGSRGRWSMSPCPISWSLISTHALVHATPRSLHVRSHGA